jgi:hypothetical protein
MPISGTWTGYVIAENAESAIALANEQFEHNTESLCWQCAGKVDEPTIGAAGPGSATVVVSDGDIADAREWIEANE